MQLNHLDLARTLADEHLRNIAAHQAPKPDGPSIKLRRWTGDRLIHIGERLTARPTELQLKVSTGPPCP